MSSHGGLYKISKKFFISLNPLLFFEVEFYF